MSTILHVGLMKTGSTSLQGRFFPHLDGTAYASHGTHELFKPLCWSLLFSDDTNFFPAPLRGFLQDLQGDEPRVLLSQEAFTWCHSDGRTARRLHQVVDDATIVIVVRSQSTILRSMYNQYLQHGGTRSVAGWLESDDFDPSLLRYDELVECYQSLFGREQVVVMAYEKLVESPEAFFAEFCERTGTSLSSGHEVVLGRANRSLARPSFLGLRWANQASRALHRGAYTPLFPQLWPKDHNRRSTLWIRAVAVLTRVDGRIPGTYLRAPGARDRRAMARVAATCAESNAHLEKLTGLSLREYGYPLPT